MTEYVRLEQNDSIATLILDRPDQRNALTLDTLRTLEQYAHQVSDDPSIRVVVISAAGDHFSVGADLHMLSETAETNLLERRQIAELGGRMLRSLREIRQPTLAAIQGVATGGGACIAAACDFRLASDTARLGYGEINMGMNLMWHALPHCVQLVGPARAKRLVMSGELFSADILAEWGFIDLVVPEPELSHQVGLWAEHYAALPPVAVQMIKRSINQYAGALDQAVMHADSDQWLLATQSGDFAEALAAFQAKRPPSFTGD